ncbi:ABC transporter permease [Bradyrhizobium lablabi]|uniref:ABC transporter permease n=1 Tax=Bradyrhizobium lablabi TaxID=722472 RepID=UPI001BA9FA9C|nr:ABC transporter permease [Bradyrhizobium lablabi]MBR0693047.1 ABC transporter permease [Bradyrhizobium lablabi]
MRLLDYLSAAGGAMRANPFRTFLTMLGIIIGVGSMISMAAIGAGAQAQVQDQIRSFGANVLMINAVPRNRNGIREAGNVRRPLTSGDARAIAELGPVRAAAPSVAGAAQVVHGSLNWATTVNGTARDHFTIRGWELAAGRLFSPDDERDAGKVVVIGSTVAHKLFGDGDPVGQIVRILNAPFEVIGVLREKGTAGDGQKQDDVVFVPLMTAMMRLIGSANTVNRDAVAYILASARSETSMTAAIMEIDALLYQRHDVADDDDKDFTVTTAASILAAQKASTRTVSFLLGSIAAVSLLVGGISIMNIMLVSVTERTREIGLRLAVGARPRDVRKQFVLEAAIICAAGGVFGVILGGLLAVGVAKFVGWRVLLEPQTALLAVAFASCVGIFFGYYPAKKAASLQPVIALRSD